MPNKKDEVDNINENTVETDGEKELAKGERQLAKEEKNMKAALAAQKKVRILIPENTLNPNEVVPVGVNGVIYGIPTGQEFEVPEPIYLAWKNHYDETRKANKKMDEVLTKEIKIY